MGNYYTETQQLNLLQVLNKQVLQLDSQSNQLRCFQNNLRFRLENLTDLLQSTKQRLESLNSEILQAQEGLENNKLQFSKDNILEILKIKNPNTTLVELADKFLLVLQEKERSWHSFKAHIKNFVNLKEIIQQIQPSNLSEEVFISLETIWENQSQIKSKLKKYCEGVMTIADFLIYLAEYRVKKETFEESMEDFAEYKKKTTMTKSKIKEVNGQILSIEEKIVEVKTTIKTFSRGRSQDDHSDTSDRSSYSSPVCCGKRSISTNPFINGTASGGLLYYRKNVENSDKPLLPNFRVSHNESYFESPDINVQEDEGYEIFYENSESLGCCKQKFFCF
ncbi:hypothetical protein SteCoe_14631 [Stentor coeruleus]|uniref:Uncharacterized protein n=1 Tax=Stentor coeruleus TaxID=5963 RepID=A0A1R2C5S6_9CILI|nr:hypothetical protein SteCoe_14631 [Stentor coeruleus]